MATFNVALFLKFASYGVGYFQVLLSSSSGWFRWCKDDDMRLLLFFFLFFWSFQCWSYNGLFINSITATSDNTVQISWKVYGYTLSPIGGCQSFYQCSLFIGVKSDDGLIYPVQKVDYFDTEFERVNLVDAWRLTYGYSGIFNGSVMKSSSGPVLPTSRMQSSCFFATTTQITPGTGPIFGVSSPDWQCATMAPPPPPKPECSAATVNIDYGLHYPDELNKLQASDNMQVRCINAPVSMTAQLVGKSVDLGNNITARLYANGIDLANGVRFEVPAIGIATLPIVSVLSAPANPQGSSFAGSGVINLIYN